MRVLFRILGLVTAVIALGETVVWFVRWLTKSRPLQSYDIQNGATAIVYVSGASRYWPSRIEPSEVEFLRDLERRAPLGCRVVFDVFPFDGTGASPRRSRMPIFWMSLRNILQGFLFIPEFFHGRAADRIVRAVAMDGQVPEKVLIIANSLGATMASGALSRLSSRIVSLGGVHLRNTGEQAETIVGKSDLVGRAGSVFFSGKVIRIPNAGHMEYFGRSYADTLEAVLNSRGWKWLQS